MTILPGSDLTSARHTARQHKEELLTRMFPARQAKAFRGTRGAPAADAPPASLLSTIPPEANIRGVGFGAKVTSGAGIDTTAVRVYVRAKQPKRLLSKSEIVPAEINGIPTDVIAVGEIFAAAVACGVSVGHVKVTAGTLGCLVKRAGASSKRFILSNNHILANANIAKKNDAILQPGKIDGGVLPAIAKLTDFEPLRFDGTPNTIDAAIAELLDAASVTPDLMVIGPIVAPVSGASVYQSVRKHGRTTLHTVGVIMDIAADVNVGYEGGRVAAFHDQLAVTGLNGGFAGRGDSGSLVVDAVSRRAVGLVVAVSQGLTYCNPIDAVLARFGVDIA